MLASALDDVLSDAERLRERPLEGAEKRNLTMSVTQCLLEAYDDGARCSDELKRFALAALMAKTSDGAAAWAAMGVSSRTLAPYGARSGPRSRPRFGPCLRHSPVRKSGWFRFRRGS